MKFISLNCRAQRRVALQTFQPGMYEYPKHYYLRASSPSTHFSSKAFSFNRKSRITALKSQISKLQRDDPTHEFIQGKEASKHKMTSTKNTPLKYTKPKHQPLGPPFSLFVTCLPGLEPSLHEEIEYLRKSWHSNDDITIKQSAQLPRIIPGGVKLTVPTITHLYILRLYLGCASHIYLRLNDDPNKNLSATTNAQIPPLFRARGFPELERKLKDLMIAQEWHHWLGVDTTKQTSGDHGNVVLKEAPWKLQIHVTTSKSKLIHTKAVEERVRNAISDVLSLDLANDGDESQRVKPTIRILVRIERDTVQLSLDTTSEPMHMRGYRKNPFKAPLREDLAYALLMSGGLKPMWDLNPLSLLLGTPQSSFTKHKVDADVHLFDPCCGSGTIAIEAAGLLNSLPPGRKALSPPLQGTKFCRHALWHDLKSLSVTMPRNKIRVQANDIDQNAINAAKLNAEEAGVVNNITFTRGHFQKHPLVTSPTERPLLIVTNPPFGQRIPSSAIYRRIAKSITSMSAQTKTISYAMLGNDPRPLRETGLPMDVKFSTKSGGINVVAMRGSFSSPEIPSK